MLVIVAFFPSFSVDILILSFILPLAYTVGLMISPMLYE